MRGDEDHARGQDRVQLNVAATGGTARSAPCPSCAHPITIAEFDVDLGEIFACPECGTELEVRGFDPLRLAPSELGEEGEND